MKQEPTKKLYSYWSELYAENGIPERSLIEPMAIRSVLGDTFILEIADDEKITYRLAGTRLCAAFGAELKNRQFVAPWHDNEKNTITCILNSSAEDGVVALFGCIAKSKSGRTVFTETLILPLLQDGNKFRRLLGITTPVTKPYWLGTDPIVGVTMTSLRIIDPALDAEPFNSRFKVIKGQTPALTASPPANALPGGKKVRHLVVMEGGKSENVKNPTV